MSTISGYRELPAQVAHPRLYHQLSQAEFEAIRKEQMESAPSLCAGHAETSIWYFEEVGKQSYIVQVKVHSRPSLHVVTPCTVTPTFGMDQIDGMLAQDAEEWILSREVAFRTNRLLVFADGDSVDTLTYLRARGVPASIERLVRVVPAPRPNQPPPARESKSLRKWWQFWK